jgi:hypothetical protein
MKGAGITMNYRVFLLIIGFSVLVWGCDEACYDHANPPPGDDEVGLVVAPAYHGGYFVAGQKYYADSGSDMADLYLAFFDEEGHTQWTTSYSTDLHNEPLAARETSDRGFLILAERSASGSSSIYYVLKVNEDGEVQWRQDISSGNLHRVVDVDATADGGFILLGYSGSHDATTLLKTDAGGGVSFVTGYGNSYVPVDVQEVSNGFVLLSNVDRNADSSTVELIRTDSWGELQWANLVWSWDFWSAWHVAEDPDGSLFIVAEENSGTSDSTPLMIKTDSHGRYLWRQDYPDVSGSTINAVISNWNGLLLAGDMNYGNDHDGFALQANDNGEWLWWHTYGDSENDWISDAVSGNNGGYVLAGTTASFNEAGDTDFYLAKISSDGILIWETATGE